LRKSTSGLLKSPNRIRQVSKRPFAALHLWNYFARRESIGSRPSSGGRGERWRTELSA